MQGSMMLLSIMMVSVPLDFKKAGPRNAKGLSDLRLVLQVIVCTITTQERHHFA
jgi:hypothetical protein